MLAATGRFELFQLLIVSSVLSNGNGEMVMVIVMVIVKILHLWKGRSS